MGDGLRALDDLLLLALDGLELGLELGELVVETRVGLSLAAPGLLELALQAEVSTRHLSFVETGRASPSREMILHLADQLDVPLRERNQLLLDGKPLDVNFDFGFFDERKTATITLTPAMKTEDVTPDFRPSPSP